MKRLMILVVMVAAVLVALGCAKKAEQAAQTASDSLLATNPVEQPQGNLTPQTTPQPPPAEQQTPPTPAPKHAAAKHTTPKTASAPKHEAPAAAATTTVPAGTEVSISIDAQLSSEHVNEGDAWTGVVKEPVIMGTRAPIPAGSAVHGVITAVHAAEKGTRAFLVLSATSITIDGNPVEIRATADSIVAGSTTARNVGAIAGSAATGALIGKMVGGGKGALIGGLIGGGAATGAVVKSKGYQAIVKEGSILKFKIEHDVKIRT